MNLLYYRTIHWVLCPDVSLPRVEVPVSAYQALPLIFPPPLASFLPPASPSLLPPLPFPLPLSIPNQQGNFLFGVPYPFRSRLCQLSQLTLSCFCVVKDWWVCILTYRRNLNKEGVLERVQYPKEFAYQNVWHSIMTKVGCVTNIWKINHNTVTWKLLNL